MALRRYRYFCQTEGVNVYEWRDDTEGPPTQCKSDPAHTVDWDSLVIVASQGESGTFTQEGYSVSVLADPSSVTGNKVLLKKCEAELEAEMSHSSEWVIPAGKVWKIRVFAGSGVGPEAELRLEYIDENGIVMDPFNNEAGMAICALKINGVAGHCQFPEPLDFTGDGVRKLRIILLNKSAIDPVELEAYFNGLEVSQG